jgi:hypothetical protein
VRWLLPILALAAACASEPGSPEWLVDRPRLLAVEASPPESKPGDQVGFRVLAVGPEGELDRSTATWSLCDSPLPLTESGAVASACLGKLALLAQGGAASIATSPDACSRFGPVGAPEVQRAREPDATGGYYQPIRVQLGDSLAFALQRLRCPLAQASFQVSQEFERRYQSNQNPGITSFSASAPLASIPAGALIDLSVAWDESSIEIFPVLDAASLQLSDQREAMSVSWFATGGELASARTGAAFTMATNRWRAPAEPGTVYLWAILRDSRGGLSWAPARANVVREIQ